MWYTPLWNVPKIWQKWRKTWLKTLGMYQIHPSLMQNVYIRHYHKLLCNKKIYLNVSNCKRISILDISNKIDYINILLLTRFLASRIILFNIAKSVASRWYQKDAWSLKEKILTWKNSKNGKWEKIHCIIWQNR